MEGPSTSAAVLSPLTVEVGRRIGDAQDPDDLHRSVVQGLKNMGFKKPHAQEKDGESIKVKFEYRSEKYAILIKKPLLLPHLHKAIEQTGKWKTRMNIYYSQGRNDVLIAVNTQDDLDKIIEVMEREKLRSLKLLLSQHTGGGLSSTPFLKPDSSGIYSNQVVPIPYSDTASLGPTRASLARSAGNSSCSSGIVVDSEGLSATSQRAVRGPPQNWRQGKVLGKGAYGSVRIAHDVDTGRDLAVKIIPIIADNREASRDMKGLEYDISELSQLQHPAIIQYLGVVPDANSILIFMEYMPGGSVKELIQSYGNLSCKLARRYISQVLDGLAYLHRSQIVHRDIKPGNILRDLDGNVKIGDFGSGKKLQEIAAHQGGLNGTIHYTAPEVLLGHTAYGRKADVWSVGVSLVEMLTGYVPWHELEPMTAMFKISYEKPIIKFPPDVDEKTRELVQVLMNRDHNQRPHAQEVLLNYFRE